MDFGEFEAILDFIMSSRPELHSKTLQETNERISIESRMWWLTPIKGQPD